MHPVVRDFFWFLVGFVLCILLCGPVHCQVPPQAPPVAVVSQAPPVKGLCQCFNGYACVCGGTVCECPGCGCKECPGNKTDYPAARARAVAEKKPLVVWVGWSDPVAAARLPEAVHVTVPEGYFGAGWIRKGVVVSSHMGGELYVVGQFPPGATGDRLRECLRPVVAQPVLPPIYGQPVGLGFTGQPFQSFGGGFAANCST